MRGSRRFLLSNQSSGLLPSAISGLVAWHDASDAATVTYDGSNLVGQWNDKSGNSRNVTQGTSLNKPSYVANSQNGLAGIRVETSKTLQLASRYSQTGDFTLVRVAKNVGAFFTWHDNTASSSTSTNGQNAFYWSSYPGFQWSLVSGTVPTFYSGSWSGPSVLIARRTGLSMDFWIDSTKTTKTALSTGLAIDYIAGGLQTNLVVDYTLYENAIYSRAITDAEVSGLQAGLKSKWGTP